jgi:hypothetical protein
MWLRLAHLHFENISQSLWWICHFQRSFLDSCCLTDDGDARSLQALLPPLDALQVRLDGPEITPQEATNCQVAPLRQDIPHGAAAHSRGA